MKSSYTKRALAFWLAVAMVATSAPMAFAAELTTDTSPAVTTSDTTVTAATSVHHIKLNQESVTVNGSAIPSVTVTAHSSEGESNNSIENNKFKVADDATGTATITAKCGDVNKSFEVKVAKKKTEDVSIVFKDFKKTVEYTGEHVVNPTVEVKVGGETKTGNVTYKYEPVALVNALSEDVGKDSVTDVGTYRVTATYDDNAGHVGYISDTFEITPKKVVVAAKSGTKISKVYDGTTTMSRSLSESDFDIAGKVGSDTLTLDVTNTELAYPNADAGTYTVNVPVKLAGDDAKNYELSASTVSVPAEITKAEFTGTKEQSVSVFANKANTYTFDMPTDVADLTDLSVSVGAVNSGKVVQSATIRNNQLEIKTKAAASEETQAVDVTVNSKNYQAFIVKYTLNVVNKTDVSRNITFADKTEYYTGKAIQLSTPSISDISASGQYKWTYTWSKDGVQTTSSGSETMPSFTEVGTYRVTAT